MKFSIIAILTTATLLGCSCQQSTRQTKKLQGLVLRAPVQAPPQIDTLGSTIQTIDFKQKASGEDLKIFENGYIPWISIDTPQAALSKLIDPDGIILAYPHVKILIDYPLKNPVTFQINTTRLGFSRRELVLRVSEKYHEIYNTEESTAKIKTVPAGERIGLMNRNETDGKYGVWGHDLSDLDLSEIEVHKSVKGEIILILGIQS